MEAKMMPTKSAEPRVDPRVTRTQKLIRDALSELLSEKSFDAISVQDIAGRATVNRATFYAHYPDKIALLDAVIRESLHERLVEGNPLDAPDRRSMLQRIAKNVFAFVASHGTCKIDRDFEARLERAMVAELHDFISPVLSGCASHLVSSSIVRVAMQSRAKNQTPVDRLIDEVVAVLSQGVGSPSVGSR